jgi:hypothetical protein
LELLSYVALELVSNVGVVMARIITWQASCARYKKDGVFHIFCSVGACLQRWGCHGTYHNVAGKLRTLQQQNPLLLDVPLYLACPVK